ncbi:MAG TPA: nuclear transport factor 2 family protein [Pyrinomonadaceae bacterium]|nr:nuclear transport factor 2 family protein [Pyrinomonadaceae bacterium]
MKRVLIAAALALVASVPASAQSRAKQSKAEREILALNREWADAMVRGDRAALERIFSDDLIVTSGDGTLRDKKGEIGDGGSEIKTYFFNTVDLRVRVYKGAAVVTGHAKWRINYQGRDIDNERRYTCVYARERGRWRMVAMQLTRVQPPPK